MVMAMLPDLRLHCGDSEAGATQVIDLAALPLDELRLRCAELRDGLRGGAAYWVRAWVSGDRLVAPPLRRPVDPSPAFTARIAMPGLHRRLLTNGMAAVLAVAAAGSLGAGPAVAHRVEHRLGTALPLAGAALAAVTPPGGLPVIASGRLVLPPG